MVRFLVVFSDIVLVACAPNPLGKQMPPTTLRADKFQGMTETWLDNPWFLRRTWVGIHGWWLTWGEEKAVITSQWYLQMTSKV